MPEIKLAKLPDRTLVKITFTASAELNQQLLDYADIYKEMYSTTENIVELIPFMLAAFIDSDIAFKKLKRAKRA
jgi:hypothetical protein